MKKFVSFVVALLLIVSIVGISLASTDEIPDFDKYLGFWYCDKSTEQNIRTVINISFVTGDYLNRGKVIITHVYSENDNYNHLSNEFISNIEYDIRYDNGTIYLLSENRIDYCLVLEDEKLYLYDISMDERHLKSVLEKVL